MKKVSISAVMRSKWLDFLIGVCLLVTPDIIQAQFSSGVEGTLRDPQGSVISGATVTLKDLRLGTVKVTTTNDSGYFRIDNIGASAYSASIQMSGFKTWKEPNLVLPVATIRTLAPVLEVGSIATSVTVSASQESINLVSATTGSLIGETTLQQTPLTGQNIYGLSALTPGMTGSAVNSGDNYTNEYSININASGLRQEENGFMIDGAFTNTPSRGGGTSISPNPEIVESMNVRTNDFDATKGRNGGAIVEVFTKPGTNDFHGSLDYYFLNNSLDSRTEFETSVPTFTRNEAGATMGGRLIKDKLFWFGAIDVLRSSTTSSGQYTVETQDFDNWAEQNLPNNLATQILQMAPPKTFPTSNFLTVSQLQAANAGYFSAPSSIPSDLNAVGTANISYSVPKNGYQWSARVDAYVGKNDRLYGDVIRTSDTSQGSNPRPALSDGENNTSDFGNINWTHTFSPRFLNSAVVDVIRPYGIDEPVDTMKIPYVTVTALQGFSNWGPGAFTQTTYGWRDVLTATIKNHTLRFGFDMYDIREVDPQTGGQDRPTYTFNNLLDFVQDEATAETGTPVNPQTGEQAPYIRRYSEFYQGYFIQDDWKLASRFTLNAGLRFDQMSNLFNIFTPQLTNFKLGSGGTYNQNVASGLAISADGSQVLDHDVRYLTPRVGFSWDIFGKGTTALRGGFGMFSDQPAYMGLANVIASNLPNIYQPSVSVYSGDATPTFQLCSAPTGTDEICPVVSTKGLTINSSGGVEINGVIQRAQEGGYSPNFRFAQIEEWTLSLEHQFKNNLMVELNYSASAGHHLPEFNQDINRFTGDYLTNNAAGGLVAPSLTRLNQNFGAIQYSATDANSIGNFGSLMVTLPTTRGLSMRGIYTYGKVLDYPLSETGTLDSGAMESYNSIYSTLGANQVGPVFVNNDNRFQRGRSDFDIRQQFSVDGEWTVPNHYASRMVRGILGNWQFGGVWIFQTGLPFTVYTSAAFSPVCAANANSSCYDGSNTWIPGSVITGDSGGDYNADGSNIDVPNAPSFGKHLSGQKKKNYLNGIFSASDFPVPSLGSEGNLGRNTYDTPGYNNLNFTFEKFFNVPWFFKEHMKIEAKGEVFNLFNRVNLAGVESDLSSTNFGHSVNQLPARELQVHLRASF